MAKFHGKVAFAKDEETPPESGVWVKVVTEREYLGDVIRESRQFSNATQVNDSLTLNNRVSIVSDDFANANFFSMVYVIVGGVYWRVSNVEIQRPRLIISFGGVYNGPKA
jgi:hypothetical protein